ncbi:MAG TPA: hypothetical protein VF257_19560 [Solirubrobacteraceae bacterium]
MPVRCALALLCLLLVAPAGARAANADIALTATGPAFAVVEAEASYAVTVANSGPSAATGVTLTDPIPEDARLVRTGGDGSCTSGDPLHCWLPSIPAGESRTVTIVLAGTRVGATLHHVITATTTSTDPTPSDHRASVDTLVTEPSVAPPPLALAAPPCANAQRGGRDDDVLDGTSFGDTLLGLEGSDLLRGGDGDDCLWGGSGNDVLDGDGGNDGLWGGDGRDRLVGGGGNDRLRGGARRDVLIGGDGDDQLAPGTGRDLVRAGAGNDAVSARDGARDVVECGPGDDRVTADRRDRLRGCEHVVRR